MSGYPHADLRAPMLSVRDLKVAFHTQDGENEVLHGIKDDASEEANAILNAEHQFLKGERLLKAGNVAKAFEDRE